MPAAVSVIIVCFNSRAHFPRLKASLEAQTVPYDLLVIDNASAPDQRPHAEDFPAHARLTQSEANLGFAAANNQLAAQAQTDFIALLNPDAFPEPDWLERLLAAAARYPHAGAFGSTQIMAGDETRYDGLGDCMHALGGTWRGGHGVARAALAPVEGEVFSVCAAAALYRAAAWREIGGLDESFFCFGEDVDLCFRLRARGWASMQIADARVAHVGGASTSSEFSRFHNARNGLWLYAKSMPTLLYWPLLPAHAAFMLNRYLGSFRQKTGEHYRRGVRAALKDLPRIWRRRRGAPLGATLRVLTWSLKAPLQRRVKIAPAR